MLVKDPSLGPKVKKFIKNPRPDPVRIPPDEMLSLVLRKNIPKDTFDEVASVVNGRVSESLGLKVCSKVKFSYKELFGLPKIVP